MSVKVHEYHLFHVLQEILKLKPVKLQYVQIVEMYLSKIIFYIEL